MERRKKSELIYMLFAYNIVHTYTCMYIRRLKAMHSSAHLSYITPSNNTIATTKKEFTYNLLFYLRARKMCEHFYITKYIVETIEKSTAFTKEKKRSLKHIYAGVCV